MKVQDFNLEEFLEELGSNPDMGRGFYSTVYNQTFQLNGDLVVKLDPVRKEDARKIALESAGKMRLLESNYPSAPEILAPNEYFLFRSRGEVNFEGKRDINIRFRTLSSDKTIDDFLEYLQELSIIEYCCEKGLAVPHVSESIGDALGVALRRCEPLITSPEGTLCHMKQGLRRKWIEDKLTRIYGSLETMRAKGYALQEVVPRIKGIKTNLYATDSDRIWEIGLDTLAEIYKR